MGRRWGLGWSAVAKMKLLLSQLFRNSQLISSRLKLFAMSGISAGLLMYSIDVTVDQADVYTSTECVLDSQEVKVGKSGRP